MLVGFLFSPSKTSPIVCVCVCLSPTTVHRNLSFFTFSYLRSIPPFTPPICSRWAEKEDEKNNWRVRSKPGRIFNPFYDCYSSVSPDSLSFIFSQWDTHVHTTHSTEMIPLWLEMFLRMNLRTLKREKRLPLRHKPRATRSSHILSPCHSWPLDGSHAF